MNSSFSLQFSNNGTSFEISPYYTPVIIYIIIFILGFPINSYVVWLIITGAGSGVASEFFVLNLCVCEIIISFYVFPQILFLLYCTDAVSYITFFFLAMLLFGRPFFQCCVCVERYVAVVHPVVFLKYKSLRFRVAISAVNWLLLLGACAFCILVPEGVDIFILAQYFILFSVTVYCYVVVLKALRRPGPGDKSVKAAEANRMKKKAFWVILTILLSMVLIYAPMVTYEFIFINLYEKIEYGFIVCFILYTVAGLVQPLLYLNRVGKLPQIRCF